MTTQHTDDRLAQLEAEHARLEAELASTRERLSKLEPLEEDVTRLRVANLGLEGRVRAQESGKGDAKGRRMSRSDFLRFGGAAAAGAVAAGASGLMSASPAAAATSGQMIIGANNSPSVVSDITELSPPFGTTQLMPTLFWANNASSTSLALPAARIAAVGTTSGVDTGSTARVGVWGQTDDAANNGAGVIGRGGTTGADPLVVSPGVATGVVGTALDNGNGVIGAANGAIGYALYGVTDAGYGVVGQSGTGISVDVRGGGRLRQITRVAAGAPTVGTFLVGEQIRDLNGDLWLCVLGGTPGTWRRAATVKEGFAGGSMNLLPNPIRLLDTRNGTGSPPGVIAAGASVNVQVTSAVAGGVPVGAVAVVGTVTVTQTQSVVDGGYLTVFAQGSPPPATSNVNWFGASQSLATAAVVALNPANGQITITNGIAGGSAPTHIIFDASGFVI